MSAGKRRKIRTKNSYYLLGIATAGSIIVAEHIRYQGISVDFIGRFWLESGAVLLIYFGWIWYRNYLRYSRDVLEDFFESWADPKVFWRAIFIFVLMPLALVGSVYVASVLALCLLGLRVLYVLLRHAFEARRRPVLRDVWVDDE